MPKRKHKQKPLLQQNIARERIRALFEQAVERFNYDPNLSNRYVQLARKISMKFKVKISSKFKRMYCKHCYCFLMPGKNCTVRLTGKTITYSCKNCRKFTRIGYKQHPKLV